MHPFGGTHALDVRKGRSAFSNDSFHDWVFWKTKASLQKTARNVMVPLPIIESLMSQTFNSKEWNMPTVFQWESPVILSVSFMPPVTGGKGGSVTEPWCTVCIRWEVCTLLRHVHQAASYLNWGICVVRQGRKRLFHRYHFREHCKLERTVLNFVMLKVSLQ